mgnify:CR=1 FL=1
MAGGTAVEEKTEAAAENRKVKLEIKDMAKKYDNGDGVEHINLKVYEGEIVTFLGPSGCGKSTILRAIGGFADVTSGDILIDGKSIVNLAPENRPTAMVFQSYNLWPHMTIYENLAFGLKLRKIPKKTIDEDIKKTENNYEELTSREDMLEEIAKRNQDLTIQIEELNEKIKQSNLALENEKAAFQTIANKVTI